MLDVQHYIESGILEEYALGVLSADERAEVERVAQQEPAVGRELAAVISGLDAYAEAHALAPPAGLRERVLEAWENSIRETGPPAAPAAPVTPVVPAPPVAAVPRMSVAPAEPAAPADTEGGAVVRQLPAAADAGRIRWLIAASVALLLISGLGNYLLYSRLKETESSLQVAQAEQSRYAATQQAALNERDQQLAILRNQAFRSVDLKGTPKAPDALARVYYNATTKAVYVDVRNLPELPEGKQYQLWALDNGQPVDAGMLNPATATGDSIQQMKNIASAQAFAVTVEDIGGKPTPTMSTLTVVGNI
ncbi:anti-sigma factor [Hymenobacter actinosclerus]|uniref:Regulator of SigK n=1 Tax=Hymenobacter actinosclerus TaxID=82805 RepID=A0A1I0JD58_9BACT|nr:anti-sigma factor [Hymenobacter actinosclerus]SEU07878.1 Anti-sigma-K factor RskA [Hymenobacter actinosclerus]